MRGGFLPALLAITKGLMLLIYTGFAGHDPCVWSWSCTVLYCACNEQYIFLRLWISLGDRDFKNIIKATELKEFSVSFQTHIVTLLSHHPCFWWSHWENFSDTFVTFFMQVTRITKGVGYIINWIFICCWFYWKWACTQILIYHFFPYSVLFSHLENFHSKLQIRLAFGLATIKNILSIL